MIKTIINFLTIGALLLSLGSCDKSLFDQASTKEKVKFVGLSIITLGIYASLYNVIFDPEYSERGDIEKDLEKIGAQFENQSMESLTQHISERFGLSEMRGQEIAKLIHFYARRGNLRSLTKSESEYLVNSVLGVSVEEIEKAALNYNLGKESGMDDFYDKISVRNETSPEHIRDLFSKYFRD